MESSLANPQPFKEFIDLLTSGRLPNVLESACPRGDTVIACSLGDTRQFFSVGKDSVFTADSQFEIGCVARSLTSLIVGIAVVEGRLSFEDCVADLSPDTLAINPALRVYHLLNQSHGLDVASLWNIPYSTDGRIDVEAIWDDVRKAGAIAPPGAFFYNYGAPGPWLAAGVAERLFGDSFTELLSSRLFKPIGATPAFVESQNMCPAYGGIALSCRELLDICKLQLDHTEDPRLPLVLENARRMYRVPIPTWPPVAESFCPGWFCYGTAYGCFGNQRKASSLMVFLSPGENAAVAIGASNLESIYSLQRTLFRSSFANGRPAPRPLSRNERAQFSAKKYVGRYEKGQYVIHIYSRSDGDLEAAVHRRVGSGEIEERPFITRTLLPALENTFYAVPAEPKIVSYIRFLPEMSHGNFSHITTGKHLFRRV